jgi:hypothetical protein
MLILNLILICLIDKNNIYSFSTDNNKCYGDDNIPSWSDGLFVKSRYI